MDLQLVENEVERSHKKVWSPSELYSFRFCVRNWDYKYNKRLDVVRPPDYKMMFGSMYHAIAEAIDLQYTVPSLPTGKEKGIISALDKCCTEIKNSPLYVPSGVGNETLIDHCRKEIASEVVKKYANYITVQDNHTIAPYDVKILALEERLQIDFGGFLIRCIPDKVIRDPSGKVWVVERKTTSRDDSQWAAQWVLNLQTTLEALCVEESLKEQVEGVLIEQVVVTRKRAKNWPYPWPQPISTLTIYPWRPVPKNETIKKDALTFVTHATREYWWRKHHKDLLTSANPNSCSRCQMNSICRGVADPETVLSERPPSPF